MGKSKKEIILGLMEADDKKQVDKVGDFISEDYVFHVAPYVGLGFNMDESEKGKLIVISLAKGSPAEKALKIGDEIVGMADELHSTQSVEELRKGMGGWGQGKIGTPITVTVMRDGAKIDLELTRAKIEGFDLPYSKLKNIWEHDMLTAVDNQKTELLHFFEDGDMVMYFARISGTINEFGRTAIWEYATVARIKNGKIVEAWSVGPGLEYYTQLGFKIEPPKV